MSDTQSSFEINDMFPELPGPKDVARWKAEAARLSVAIQEFQKKEKYVLDLIRVVEGLGQSDSSDASEPRAEQPRIDSEPDDANKSANAVAFSSSGRIKKGLWTEIVKEIADEYSTGISYENLKKQLPDELRKIVDAGHSKSFYGAMGRLESSGDYVRSQGHFFTKRGFEKYQRNIAVGNSLPILSSKTRSTVGMEVLRFLRDCGPSKAIEIKSHLCTFDDFRAPIKRNPSYVYNVLKTLVDREEVHHDKERALFFIASDEKRRSAQVADS